MSEREIITEVAGRVCTIAVAAGAHVDKGDDVVVVEAMKMEIPATAPTAGRVTAVLVNVDDMVSEGQAVAILES